VCEENGVPPHSRTRATPKSVVLLAARTWDARVSEARVYPFV
jgi:hypothetical protein